MRTRISYVNGVLIFFGVFFFGCALFSSGPAMLIRSAEDMFAAVGVTATIAPNPYNSVAEQLANKEARLNTREAELATQERALSNSPSNQYGFYSLCISVALFVLVALNFYFDIRRRAGRTA